MMSGKQLVLPCQYQTCFGSSAVGSVTLSMHDAYNCTFLLNLKRSAFDEILSETVHKKETLLSFDVDEGRYSATLTSQNDFHHLKIFPMLNFSRESGKFWVVDSLSSRCVS
jgi:hypothetical protein